MLASTFDVQGAGRSRLRGWRLTSRAAIGDDTCGVVGPGRTGWVQSGGGEVRALDVR